MEFFKIYVRAADKVIARKLCATMKEQEAVSLPLSPVPLSAVEDFLEGKRKDLWRITVNGDEAFKVVADKRSAEALVRMLKESKLDALEMAPILLVNLEAYLKGTRNDVIMLELALVAKGEEEELMGHV
jgi:hypothetical protein